MSIQRVALVTGCNRGIGTAICRQLADNQLLVIVTARDEAKGRASVKEMEGKNRKLDFHTLDTNNPESIRAAIGYAERTYGRLDVLVNNAGVFLDRDIPGLSVDLATVRATLETNVLGPLLLAQAAVPLMKKNGYGRMVNLSSGLGSLAGMGGAYLSYRTSKAALNAITRVLAAELSGTNILVNTMCPGWVRTDMGGASAPRNVEEGADTALWLATLPDGGPTGGFYADRKPMAW